MSANDKGEEPKNCKTQLKLKIAKAFLDLKGSFKRASQTATDIVPTPRGDMSTGKWDKGQFLHDGTYVPYYVAHAQNPHTVIGLITGFNSNPESKGYPEIINRMAKQGFSVVTIPLPMVGKRTDFISDYESLIDFFYTSENSPLFSEIRCDIPRVALTHSTGGLVFNKLIGQDGARQRLEARLNGAIHAAPFYESANSSSIYAPRKDNFFRNYASKRLDTPADKALLASMVRRFFAIWDSSSSKDEHFTQYPTFGQILTLKEEGVKEITRPSVETSLPQHFAVGNKDSSACSKTSAHFAANHNIPCETFNGGHNPLLTRERCKEWVLETAFQMAHGEPFKGKEDTPIRKAKRLIRDEAEEVGEELSDMLTPRHGKGPAPRNLH